MMAVSVPLAALVAAGAAAPGAAEVAGLQAAVAGSYALARPYAGMAGPDTGVAGPDTGVAGPDTGVAGPDTGVAGPDTGVAGPEPGLVALRYALAQVGTPYRWGGEQPGVGFDCSGLAQAAWAAAGVSIPRVADDQMKAGRAVEQAEPGDLVFFGPPGGPASHVGLVVDPSGLMVDAPHAGVEVRVERFDPRPGSHWGGEVLLGATHPAGPGN
jgi:cell wall-associated NlpC family hydrolase